MDKLKSRTNSFRQRHPSRFCILILLVLAISACGGGGGSSNTSAGNGGSNGCPSVSGAITANIGSTAGGRYTLYPQDGLNGGDSLNFSNTDLNFDVLSFNFGAANIINLGSSICLANVSTWPGGGSSTVSATIGDVYVVQYTDGYLRFIDDGYSNGTVTVTYVVGLATAY